MTSKYFHWKSTSAALDPHHPGVLVTRDAYLKKKIYIN